MGGGRGEVASPPSLDPARGSPVIVALGDSFMSGEGAERFIEGTNTRRENECRRSDTAYAPTLDQASPPVTHTVVFVACSGARGRNLYEEGQYPDEPTGGPGTEQLKIATDTIARLDLKPTLVVVGIGGNDALFGRIAQTCLAPGDCSSLGGAWLTHLTDAVEPELDRTLAEVDEAFPTTPVAIVPYPVPIGTGDCDWGTLTSTERRFIAGFTSELNAVIRRSAGRNGLHFVADMQDALKGQRLCDGAADRSGVNFLAANPTNGTAEQTVNPFNWLHNSLHPNKAGHRAMRNTLAEWLRHHPNLASREGSMNDPARVRSITELMNDRDHQPCRSEDPGYCGPDSSRWIYDQVSTGLLPATLPLLAILGGSWTLTIHIMAAHRRSTPNSPTARSS